jgi:AcrR family transcriptional regulator
MGVSPARERIILSAIAAMAEKSYEDLTIADIVDGAKLSRTTFYEEFEGKEECVLAAYDWAIDYVLHRVESAYQSGASESWPEGVRAGLDAFLRVLAETPEISRAIALEVPTAGPAAHARFRAAVERFLPFFEPGIEFSERGEQLPTSVGMMAIGGAEAIIFDEVAGGRAEKLPEIMPSILFTMLVPYLGPEDAADEMHAAASVG